MTFLPQTGSPAGRLRCDTWRRRAAAAGRGLVVMLADSEAGGVIAAAQGGAAWGFRLVLRRFASGGDALVVAVVFALTVGRGRHPGIAGAP